MGKRKTSKYRKQSQSAREIARKADRKNKSEYDLDDGFTAQGAQIRRLALISKLERLAESRLVELKELQSIFSQSEANMKTVTGSSMTEKEVLEALSAIDSKATTESIEAEFALLKDAIRYKQEQIELLNDAMGGDPDEMIAAIELAGESETEAKWSKEQEDASNHKYHQDLVSEDLSLSGFSPSTPGLKDLLSHGGPATYQDYQHILEEESERNKAFKGAKTAEQYQANKQYTGAGRQATRFNDPILGARWQKVREDIVSMDCADILFSSLRAKPFNTNIMAHQKHAPGDPNDVGNFLPEDGIKDNHQYVMQLLKQAKPFAFPSWWFAESRMLWRIRNLNRDTHDFPYQFPMCGTKEVAAEDAKFFRSLNPELHPKGYLPEKPILTLVNRKKARNVTVGFPENTPFSNTFIGLENPDEMLIYQRSRNQQSMVREFMAPTSAYSPDGEKVPLDAIYATGFLFCKSVSHRSHNVPIGDMNGSVIYGLYTGYVISQKHCPNDMDFLRIPMIVPLYMDGLSDMFQRTSQNNPDNERVQSNHSARSRKNNWFFEATDISEPLNHLMQAIDDHSVVQVEFNHAQKRQKRTLKAREGISVSHKRYSRVQMTGGVSMPSTGYSDSEPTGMLPKWKLDHRVDCREHDRCYIRRGTMPISTDERSLLEGRGYTIYTDCKDVSLRDAKRFNRRRIPHPDGIDWVAIRTIRVPEHHRGPEGKKIVPLVRVTKDEVIANSLEYELSDPLKAV